MKKITDERLIVRNLKNIRIAFGLENLTILGFLVFQIVKTGDYFEVMTYNNPPFVFLMLGCFSLLILSLNVSAPMEDKDKKSVASILRDSLLTFIVALLFFYFLAFPDHHLLLALVCGAIIGLVMFAILTYANKFRS